MGTGQVSRLRAARDPEPAPVADPFRIRAALAILIVLAFVLAWFRRFFQDDAYISLRYARNLARGFGLVYNPGERVEGYSNFLWTLALSVPFRLGIDPVAFSHAVGLAAFAGSLLLTWRLAARLAGTSDYASAGTTHPPVPAGVSSARFLAGWASSAPFLAVLLLAANHSFSAYATGGMETSLQTFLCLAFFDLAAAGAPGFGRAAAASFVAACALLTRPDSVLLLAAGVPVLAARWRGLRVRTLLAAASPGLLPVALWLCWKLFYYGGLLPNPWYVKSTGTSVLRGALYVGTFLLRYLLLFLLPVIGAAFVRGMRFTGGRERPGEGEGRAAERERRAAWRGIGAGLLLWIGYLMAIGGDFMEYRMMVPVLPWIVVAVVVGISEWAPWKRAVVAAALILAGVLSPVWPRFWGTPEPTRQLADAAREWRDVGEALREALGGSKVAIAVTAAGALPYHADLQTIDLMGLNDPWVARSGARIPPHRPFAGTKPGHSRIATLPYLEERGVHLLLNSPWLVPADSSEAPAEAGRWPGYSVPIERLPEGARVIEIPVRGRGALRAIQLRPHGLIDSLVACGAWSLPGRAR